MGLAQARAHGTLPGAHPAPGVRSEGRAHPASLLENLLPDDVSADVSGEILGLTAIGRATITSLSMNRVLAVAIRYEEWTAIDGRDGLFAARVDRGYAAINTPAARSPTVCRASTFLLLPLPRGDGQRTGGRLTACVR